ncbi:hypothetical protein [Lutispora sp.]
MEGNAVISNTGVYMGNQEIRIGSPLGGIKGKKFAVKGFVYNIIFNE